MTGWIVNDKLTCIPGTRTFWNHLLDTIPVLEDRCTGQYAGLADKIERDAARENPDYIIRNAAYFRWLNVSCPVISLVQDVMDGEARELLLESCAASSLVVFNSEYTKMVYPELETTRSRIIPIGTDTNVFRPVTPHPRVPKGSVLWIGSGHRVKGFDLACYLASESKRPWVFVMKDDTPVDVDAMVFRSIPQEQLASIASACSVGVCTSLNETQHLAGIEMGLCGLPLVTTEVGSYYGREPGPWGKVINGDWQEEIEAVADLPRDGAVSYWTEQGFGLERCMDAWREAVESLEVADVVR